MLSPQDAFHLAPDRVAAPQALPGGATPARDPFLAAAHRPVRPVRRIQAAALVSLVLHAAVLGSAWLWMRHKAAALLVPPGPPPVVQLVMSPPGGEPHPAPAPRTPAPDTPKVKPDARPTQAAPKTTASKSQASKPPAAASKTEAAAPKAAPQQADSRTDAPPSPPPPPETASDSGAIPPPAAEPQTEQATAAEHSAPAARSEAEPPKVEKPAPTQAKAAQPAAPATKPDDMVSIDLAQAESDTNGWVTGNDVLPPTANVKYHNRKPSYPSEAVLRGEQGTVLLLIHVGADGLVEGVDVTRSSGFPALDRAALDAVRGWHYLPSIRDGRPVPSDVPARFVFALE